MQRYNRSSYHSLEPAFDGGSHVSPVIIYLCIKQYCCKIAIELCTTEAIVDGLESENILVMTIYTF